MLRWHSSWGSWSLRGFMGRLSASPKPGSAGQSQRCRRRPAPSESPDDNVLIKTTAQPPVVAGTSTMLRLRCFAADHWLVASRSYIIPSIFFFGPIGFPRKQLPLGGVPLASINTLMAALPSRNSTCSQLNIGYLAGRSFSSQEERLIPPRRRPLRRNCGAGSLDGFILDKFMYSSQFRVFGRRHSLDITGLNTVRALQHRPVGPAQYLSSRTRISLFSALALSNALVAQVNNHLGRRTFFTMGELRRSAFLQLQPD